MIAAARLSVARRDDRIVRLMEIAYRPVLFKRGPLHPPLRPVVSDTTSAPVMEPPKARPIVTIRTPEQGSIRITPISGTRRPILTGKARMAADSGKFHHGLVTDCSRRHVASHADWRRA